MLRAQLRRLHSPDVANLETHVPAEPECFGILVQAMVGPEDMPGEESFDFIVCTPRWLTSKVVVHGYAVGRHHLVVRTYEYEVIRGAISDLCEKAVGPDWLTVASKLGRFGKWEFEDYRAATE